MHFSLSSLYVHLFISIHLPSLNIHSFISFISFRFLFIMIHVRINRYDPASVDIYVNVPDTSVSQRHSTPLPISDDQEHIYDRLFDKKPTIRSAQSTVVNQRTTNRKHYTLQQILDNVETIQDQYEKVVKNRQSSSTLTCFSSLKQWRKSLKHRRRSMKSSSSSSSSSTSSINRGDNEHRSTSPFMFGGETLQWFVYPREHSEHIYENAFLS